MYVCICNAVTDSDIKRHVERGVSSMRELRAATGCAGTCGQCAPEARAILQATAVRRPQEATSDLNLTPVFA